MSGKPFPRPVSSRRRRLGKAETDAMIAWKTGNPFMEAHHIITQQALRKRGHADLLWDTRNRLWLTRERHEQHHSCYRKIRRSELPEAALAFAEEIGMQWWIDHVYPAGEVTEGDQTTVRQRPDRGSDSDLGLVAIAESEGCVTDACCGSPSVTSSDEMDTAA